jgi:glycosyltransferase involved in cell wall biosynthesis
MRICFVGTSNIAVLAPEYREHRIGGESVQQTLIARALARRGHDVTMVVQDYGQPDGAVWDRVTVYRTYRPDAGIPVVRFMHPRWTGMWSALKRANADLYYVSEAGMQVGLVALFCRRHRRRFVFRTASDADCYPDRLLVRFARDRWLYEFGLRRADAVLVQTAAQAEAMARNYGLPSRVARMLVEPPRPERERDIDLLWISNMRALKRPERMLALASALPEARAHMVGGPITGEEMLFDEVRRAATARANLVFHGRISYWDANDLYDRARLLINTSDIEGFPNAYLQAWARGVPVIALIDPDGLIEREGLGIAVKDPDGFAEAAGRLLREPRILREASDRCRRFMAREYGEDRVLAAYLETFEAVLRKGPPGRAMKMAGSARNV